MINLGENITIGQSLLITVFSMLVVFVVLLGISYLIELLRIATNGKDEKEDKIVKEIEKKEIPETVEENLEDEELVAVIAAAIAASMGVGIPDINIKSIKRNPSSSNVWSETGRTEYMTGKL